MTAIQSPPTQLASDLLTRERRPAHKPAPRHLLRQTDLTAADIASIFSCADALKHTLTQAYRPLLGRSLVMLFEKASTRTRLSFEIGMTQLGGHAVTLDHHTSQLSRGESLGDTAQVISRYADIMMARVNFHQSLTELAENATIPVINGLSDEEHPCQSMTDLFTIQERLGGLAGVHLTYVGDGDNNVARSLLLGAALLGIHTTIAAPPSLQPSTEVMSQANGLAVKSGGSVTVTADARDAVRDADVIYTDVWISMGDETTAADRRASLHPYQVNADLMAEAGPHTLFMHCLPAHYGEEVTEDVAYGPQSVIFDQAENRMHVQKAIMLHLLGLLK